MNVAVASDHRSFEAKRRLIPELKRAGHNVEDFGCEGTSACDYPDYILNKVASKKFSDTGGAAWTLVKNFSWTNDDQNSVAASINSGKTHDEAGKIWVDANEAKWKAWIPGS